MSSDKRKPNLSREIDSLMKLLDPDARENDEAKIYERGLQSLKTIRSSKGFFTSNLSLDVSLLNVSALHESSLQ